MGNPTPDFDASVRKGDNLYSNSSLALDPATGKIKFHFQYTPNDAWDYDGNNEMILVNDEKGRKVWLNLPPATVYTFRKKAAANSVYDGMPIDSARA